MVPSSVPIDLDALALAIKAWGRELGFAEVRIAGVDLSDAEDGLRAWLEAGMNGEMDYRRLGVQQFLKALRAGRFSG